MNSLFQQAQTAHQQGQFAQAERLYRKLLRQQPAHADIHHLLGIACSQQGRHDEAARHLQQAVRLNPQNPLYHNNLAEVWRLLKRFDLALPAYQQALTIAPDFAEAHFNLANLLQATQQIQPAIAHYQATLRTNPQHWRAQFQLGQLYQTMGHFNEALACYQAVSQQQPQFEGAPHEMGVIYLELKQFTQAIEQIQRVLALNPNSIDAQANLGLAYAHQGQIESARQSYQPVLAREKENDLLRFFVDTLCPPIPLNNADIDQYRADLDQTLDSYLLQPPRLDLALLELANIAPPIALHYQGRDDRALKEKWASLFAPQISPPPPKPRLGHKPHLGFVVTHGHERVFMKDVGGLLNNLSPDKFQLTVICGQSGAQFINPLQPHINMLPIPPHFAQALTIIQEAQFDLLYYWEIGSDVINYFLPMYRPAPIQCLSWGTAITSGLSQVDYYLSAKDLETADSQACYTEKLVTFDYLPVYYYRPQLPETLLPRDHFGLNEAQHLYLCAQIGLKIHPDFDPLLAEILRRDPQGIVLLLYSDNYHATLLQQRFQQTMPDVLARVKFLPRLTPPEYLSLLAQVNVSLDTIYYCGGNTSFDALAVGTPTVTWPSQFQRGRTTYALYKRMAFMECVVDSFEAYVNKAVQLGTDPAYREQVSHEITARCGVWFEDMSSVQALSDFFEEVLAGEMLAE